MTHERDSIATALHEEIGPTGYIVAAVVYQFKRRALRLGPPADRRPVQTVVAARVGLQHMNPKFQKLPREALQQSGRVEVAGQTVQQDRCVQAYTLSDLRAKESTVKSRQVKRLRLDQFTMHIGDRLDLRRAYYA